MNIAGHHGQKKHKKGDILPQLILSSKQNVIALELDIQHTKDNFIVVYHDKSTPNGQSVNNSTYKDLLTELPHLHKLSEIFSTLPNQHFYLESKTNRTIAKSIKMLKKRQNYAVASFCKDEILATKIHLPHVNTFLLQHYHPFGIVKKAIDAQSNGIAINKNWLIILPYYYWQCRRNKLDIYTYTLNAPWISKFINKTMPKIIICTDNPKDVLKTNEK